MFLLHETTKIWLCRAAFVVLCVVPTCAVVTWSVVIRTPAYRAAHERALGGWLASQAHLAGVSTPRPGTTLYEQLELVDPETRQRLASLPFVEVQASGADVTIRLPYPAIINGNRLDAFWRVAGDALRRTSSWRQLRFEARNLTLHLNVGDQTFTDVAAQAEVDDEQARFSLGFRPATAGTPPSEAAELSIARHRRGAAPASIYKFTTGAAGLPCSLLASFWPAIERVGRSGVFAGSVSAHEQSGRWRAEMRGRLSGIDLGLLLADFPHKFTGMAEAQLDLVRIDEGHVAAAVGRMIAGPGFVSRSLIEAAQANLHLQATLEAIDGPDERPYDHMAIAFDAGAQGLTMRGAAERPRGAVIVDSQERVLMHQASPRQVPVVNLVRTLVPQSAVQVPATRETAGLVTWLPVPSIAAPAEKEAPTLKARLLPIPIRK